MVALRFGHEAEGVDGAGLRIGVWVGWLVMVGSGVHEEQTMVVGPQQQKSPRRLLYYLAGVSMSDVGACPLL